MARIATGSIVADIAGKVGDNIYSRNRQGPYVKAYAAPVQPGSASQILAQTQFSNAVLAWAALTDDQYIAYVAFAEQFQRSAFNVTKRKVDPRSFFISNSLNRQNISESARPRPVMPGDVGFLSFELDLSDGIHMYGTWRGGVNNSDYYMTLFSTIPKSLGVHSINSVQQVYFHKFTYQSDTQKDLWPNWFARFGGSFPTTAERAFFSTKIIHVLSGINVGFGWNSSIGAGAPVPFNMGNEDVRSSTANFDKRRAMPVVAPQNGNINSLTFHSTSGVGNIIVGVYSDSGGTPNTRLAISAPTAMAGANQWQLIPLLSPLAISSGVTYWLAIVGEAGATFRYNVSPIPWKRSGSSVFDLPSSFGSILASTNGASFYATATP